MFKLPVTFHLEKKYRRDPRRRYRFLATRLTLTLRILPNSRRNFARIMRHRRCCCASQIRRLAPFAGCTFTGALPVVATRKSALRIREWSSVRAGAPRSLAERRFTMVSFPLVREGRRYRYSRTHYCYSGPKQRLYYSSKFLSRTWRIHLSPRAYAIIDTEIRTETPTCDFIFPLFEQHETCLGSQKSPELPPNCVETSLSI